MYPEKTRVSTVGDLKEILSIFNPSQTFFVHADVVMNGKRRVEVEGRAIYKIKATEKCVKIFVDNTLNLDLSYFLFLKDFFSSKVFNVGKVLRKLSKCDQSLRVFIIINPFGCDWNFCEATPISDFEVSGIPGYGKVSIFGERVL